MKYIATVLLLLMAISLIFSDVLLWRRRKEPGDYSRMIWAIFSWVSSIFALTFIMRTWQETTTADGAFIEPEHTFVPILIQMTFFLYPLEVIRPTVNSSKIYVLLFMPLILLVLIGMCAGIEYTPIYSHADMWGKIGEFNVWFRLFALVLMLLYSFALFLVPYDWSRSSADKKFILSYSCGFCIRRRRVGGRAGRAPGNTAAEGGTANDGGPEDATPPHPPPPRAPAAWRETIPSPRHPRGSDTRRPLAARGSSQRGETDPGGPGRPGASAGALVPFSPLAGDVPPGHRGGGGGRRVCT